MSEAKMSDLESGGRVTPYLNPIPTVVIHGKES